MGECVARLTKPVVEPARLLRVPGLIAAAFLVFCIPAYVQNTSGNAGLSAGELLRRVVNSELKAQAQGPQPLEVPGKSGYFGKRGREGGGSDPRRVS
jgi:hypothetical protein